jgi:hypothetical protein
MAQTVTPEPSLLDTSERVPPALRLGQFRLPDGSRCVGHTDGDVLRVLKGVRTTYDHVPEVLAADGDATAFIDERTNERTYPYDDLLSNGSRGCLTRHSAPL